MNQEQTTHPPAPVGILGFGGLGKAAALVLAPKREMSWVAVADHQGYAYDPAGLDALQCGALARAQGSVGYLNPGGVLTDQGIESLLGLGNRVEGYFLALPNLPNTFMATIVQRIIAAGWRGVLVDALKRTSAMEQLFDLAPQLQQAGITYVTGCGATPGLLTAAAVLGAQSYAQVHQVDITFGVGIANWEAYKATIREDIAHLPGYTVERAMAMSEAEVSELLDRTQGRLCLEGMEHADDLILELAGICPRDQVRVGGIVDTRSAAKPISTHVKVTGRTFEGKISTHTFTLGDETSMAANVCGPAFGYLKTGLGLHRQGIYGLFTCADLMPQFVR